MKLGQTIFTAGCLLAASVASAESKPPTIYGNFSVGHVEFSDSNFLGTDTDATPYMYEAIVGAKGLHFLENGMKLAYRFEADFAPIAEADGSYSKYYGATSTEDQIFIRYAGGALITKYGLFAFGDAMSGVYSEFYKPVDVFEVNTQDSTPSGAPNGMRMWSQTKWSKDGWVYKTPVWNNMYMKFVYASINNTSGESDDLKIAHWIYDDMKFMVGVNLSTYDKTIAGASDGETDRKRLVVASHYNFENATIAGVYEKNTDLGAASADFDVWAVTGTYNIGKVRLALSYQDREDPEAGAIIEDSATIAQVKYAMDPMMDIWVEAGQYAESENDNVGAGVKIRF